MGLLNLPPIIVPRAPNEQALSVETLGAWARSMAETLNRLVVELEAGTEAFIGVSSLIGEDVIVNSLTASSITTVHLAASAVTADKIFAKTIVTSNLADSSVTTIIVERDAVSAFAEVSTTALSTHTSTTETVVDSVTISTTTGRVEVYAQNFQATNAGSVTPGIVRLRKGTGATGTLLDEGGTITTARSKTNLFAIDTSPATSQTYVVTAYRTAATAEVNFALEDRRLQAINTKR